MQVLDEDPVALADSRAIREALASARAHLGMDVAFIGEFLEGRRVFRYVDAEGSSSPVTEGGDDPLSDSYCQRVVDGRLPAVIPDATKVPAAAELPVTHRLPVGAHISVPIRTPDGRVFGTFCCFSHQPEESLRERDANALRILADLVAGPLARESRARAGRAQAATAVVDVITSDGLTAVYQPIVDVQRGVAVGYEALARFPDGASPDTWFTRAASAGLGVQLEVVAISTALPALAVLPADTYLSVNASEEALRSEALLNILDGVQPERVVLELTEHVVVADVPGLLDALAPLRARGVRLAVDDTGSGYSGLRQLLDLRPDILKIDRGLTQGIDSDPARQALAWALSWFAGSTDATVVAEGIETEAELETLRSLGVGCGQGYYLGRPGPLPQVAG
ncbi:MAG TPA: EAL domain-containing protein [Actinomycetes bacterium]|nr:EAL domain-containing protein [Actinomycetes bacterium]